MAWPPRGLLVTAPFAIFLGCAAPPLEYPEGSTALVGVDVAWMGDDQLLPDRRIVLHAGRILDVLGPDDGALSDDVAVLATGGYVMPGLADLHVHAWFESDLTLFVANGVTTVRNLFGDPLQRDWRDEIAAGERFGPTIITAGPIIDGSPPIWNGSDVADNAAEGAAFVDAQIDAGYDLVKVYNRLGEPAWRGVLDEAAARGVPAVGHVPFSVSYSDVAASSQGTIEHLDGLLEELAGFAWWDPLSEQEVRAALAAVPPTALPGLADVLTANSTWNVPTLVVLSSIRIGAADLDARLAAPELAYVHPQYRASWQATVAATPDEMAAWAALMEGWMGWVRALHDAGAGIALGTDCGNAFVIAGYSVHEELNLLVQSGLTPYEALRAGTAGAAQAAGRADDFGQVVAGQRADLLWLQDNPLDDVSNAREPAAVVLGGRWIPRAELDSALDDVAASYAR